MANPTLILGANNWAIEEDNILGYALGSSSNQYLPREISFTRGSDATYTDSTGVIRQACWNLLQYSEEFTNGVWNTTGATIAANSITAPNGSLTADTITQTGGTLNVSQAFTIASPGNYTYSTYLKKGNFDSSSLFRFGVYQGVDIGYITYNFATNTTSVISGTFISHSSTSIGDGWYRIQYTINITSTGTAIFYNGGVGGSIGTSNFFYSWGAQLVQGSEPLAYLRTTDRLNIPRVDSSTGSKAFLLEPQRTNTMLYSEAINSWAVKTELTITDNNAVSPRGTQDASYIQQTTGGNAVVFQSQSVSVTTGQAQTVTFYAKAKEVTSITLRLGTTALWSGGARPAFTCDLLTGSISVGTGTATVSSQNVGNGWYRFIVTTPATLTSGVSTLQTPTGTVFSPTSGDGFYLWGVQWEQNASYPTTYMPTQASTVTRLADSALRTGISSLLGQSEGTVFMDVYFNQASNAGFKSFFCLEGSVSSQFSGFTVATTNSGNNVNYAGTNYDLTTGRHKIACTYSQTNNQRKLFVDGVLRSTSTHTNFLATIDRVSIGCRINPFSSFNTDRELSSGILHFATYPELVSDSELVTLTTL